MFIKMTGKIVGEVCWLHFWYSAILECAWKDEKCFFLMYLYLQFTVYIFSSIVSVCTKNGAAWFICEISFIDKEFQQIIFLNWAVCESWTE